MTRTLLFVVDATQGIWENSSSRAFYANGTGGIIATLELERRRSAWPTPAALVERLSGWTAVEAERVGAYFASVDHVVAVTFWRDRVALARLVDTGEFGVTDDEE